MAGDHTRKAGKGEGDHSNASSDPWSAVVAANAMEDKSEAKGARSSNAATEDDWHNGAAWEEHEEEDDRNRGWKAGREWREAPKALKSKGWQPCLSASIGLGDVHGNKGATSLGRSSVRAWKIGGPQGALKIEARGFGWDRPEDGDDFLADLSTKLDAVGHEGGPCAAEVLDVAESNMSTTQLKQLFKLLGQHALPCKRIVLFGCATLDDAAMSSIAAYLEKLGVGQGPAELHLSHCALTSIGLDELMKAIEEGTSVPYISPKTNRSQPLYLRLEYNHIDPKSIKSWVDWGLMYPLLRKNGKRYSPFQPLKNTKVSLFLRKLDHYDQYEEGEVVDKDRKNSSWKDFGWPDAAWEDAAWEGEGDEHAWPEEEHGKGSTWRESEPEVEAEPTGYNNEDFEGEKRWKEIKKWRVKDSADATAVSDTKTAEEVASHVAGDKASRGKGTKGKAPPLKGKGAKDEGKQQQAFDTLSSPSEPPCARTSTSRSQRPTAKKALQADQSVPTTERTNSSEDAPPLLPATSPAAPPTPAAPETLATTSAATSAATGPLKPGPLHAPLDSTQPGAKTAESAPPPEDCAKLYKPVASATSAASTEGPTPPTAARASTASTRPVGLGGVGVPLTRAFMRPAAHTGGSSQAAAAPAAAAAAAQKRHAAQEALPEPRQKPCLPRGGSGSAKMPRPREEAALGSQAPWAPPMGSLPQQSPPRPAAWDAPLDASPAPSPWYRQAPSPTHMPKPIFHAPRNVSEAEESQLLDMTEMTPVIFHYQ